MKNIKVIIITLVVLLLSFFSACIVKGYTKYYFDENINSKVTSEIRGIDEEIIKALRNADFMIVEKHYSDALLDTGYNFQGLFEYIAPTLENREVNIYKEVYAISTEEKKAQSVAVEDLADEEGLFITFSGYSKKMYISMYSFSDGKSETLLFIEHVNENNTWQVYRMTFGELSYFGMDAQGIYQKAQDLYEKGYEIAAAVYIPLYTSSVRPAEYIQYANESEMQSFFEELSDAVNKKYVFPMVLSQNSDVEIYGFDINVVSEGVIPTINYITKIEPIKKNSQYLQNEAYSIHEELKGIFEGFDESFDYFIYRAFTEHPSDPLKQYYSYSSIVEKAK